MGPDVGRSKHWGDSGSVFTHTGRGPESGCHCGFPCSLCLPTPLSPWDSVVALEVVFVVLPMAIGFQVMLSYLEPCQVVARVSGAIWVIFRWKRENAIELCGHKVIAFEPPSVRKTSCGGPAVHGD